jgi:hypothetical protein
MSWFPDPRILSRVRVLLDRSEASDASLHFDTGLAAEIYQAFRL